MLLVWAPLASPTRALALLVGDPKLRPDGTKGPGAAAAGWAGPGSVLSGAALAHPLGVFYALRTLRNLPPSAILVLISQLVQALRHDASGQLLEFLTATALSSDFFAHPIIWNCRSEKRPSEQAGPADPLPLLVAGLKRTVIQRFSPLPVIRFREEFQYFDELTSISEKLRPGETEASRRTLMRELTKLGERYAALQHAYLPTNPLTRVLGAKPDTAKVLKSHAHVPFLVTFVAVLNHAFLAQPQAAAADRPSVPGAVAALIRQRATYAAAATHQRALKAAQAAQAVRRAWRSRLSRPRPSSSCARAHQPPHPPRPLSAPASSRSTTTPGRTSWPSRSSTSSGQSSGPSASACSSIRTG